MEIKFTPAKLQQFEEAIGNLPFYIVFQTPTMKQIRLLVKAGLGAEDDAIVDREISAFTSEGKSFEDLVLFLMQRLEDGHFLSRLTSMYYKIEMDKKQKMMEGLISEATITEPKPLENTGEQVSQVQ